MTQDLKKRLLNYLENGGSEDERKSLITKMKEDEMPYVDIYGMCLSTKDDACENLSVEDLQWISDEIGDELIDKLNALLPKAVKKLYALADYKAGLY